MASIGMMQSDEGKTITQISAFGKKLSYVAAHRGRASTQPSTQLQRPYRIAPKLNVMFINPLNCLRQRSRGWPCQAWP